MRSQFLKSSSQARSLIKTPAAYHRALLSSTHAIRYPRKERAPPQSTPRLSKRASSSTPVPAEPETPPDDSPAAAPSATEPPPDDAGSDEKPRRRTRVTSTKEVDPVLLPPGLDILWTPAAEDGSVEPSSSTAHAENLTLPPQEIFDEILHNLHVVLHPQTQHRGTYVTNGQPLVEPTLALYCPFEGGDYILDVCLTELARRTGADVVVLDSVQLAAGECGDFGKAASALQLPSNPLHFASASSSRESIHPLSIREEHDDDEGGESPFPFSMGSPMTVHVMAALPTRSVRGVLTPASRSPSPTAKLKAFFDELINIPPATPPVTNEDESVTPPASPRRPRIIYVRDFPTLAPSVATWYPALLAAVRQRRQGALSRPSAAVVNPTAIVFGTTPSFLVPESSHSTPSGVNFMVNSQRGENSNPGAPLRTNRSEYGEDAASDKAREKRVQRRLKRWARGHTWEDLPRLNLSAEDVAEAENAGPGKPNIVVMGQEGFGNLPSFLGSAVSRALASRANAPSAGNHSGFFRSSLVVPTVRSLSLERDSRMGRRREVNELVMRMGVAQVGGSLGPLEDTPAVGEAVEAEPPAEESVKDQLWKHWGQTVEVWPNVQRIADRAVGSVLAQSRAFLPRNRSLDPTPVPWSAVFDAWAADRSTQDAWKTWFGTGKTNPDNEDQAQNEAEEEPVDEIIEKLRRDPDLDQHEQRLLGCIVDTGSLTTTFNQVHLPPHTIDSIRTIVSLPLLHPSAFKHGILKEHSMTGCLLFGPPGTGKTLVVRALAKEAGCRMLMVAPSDVMDMYVGEGEKLVRAVFSLARRLSPCVVFIDELDALLGARLSRESGGALAHRGVITEFMQEMDGLKSSKDSNVIVIGATNRPFDLDDAVLRRLPRRLLVDLPGEKEREEILKILLRDETLDEDVDFKTLAQKTESFSGSDLKHLCVSAALDAVKENVVVPWRPNPTPEAGIVVDTSDETNNLAVPDPEPTPSDPALAEADSTTTPTAENLSDSSNPAAEVEEAASDSADEPPHTRSLAWRNFEQALKEITPSASEALGSLAELRKWNDEFGEGRRKKKHQVWGKDRFGFVISAPPVQLDAATGSPPLVVPGPASPPSVVNIKRTTNHDNRSGITSDDID